MLDSLTNEDAVERISMKQRQLGKVSKSFFYKRKGVDPVPLPLPGYVAGSRFRQRETTQLVFYENLPERNHAQPDFMDRRTHGLGNARRQASISGKEPKKARSVEEQPQRPSNSRRIDSGKGSSNSRPTLNSPAQSPMGRGFPEIFLTGRISAIG